MACFSVPVIWDGSHDLNCMCYWQHDFMCVVVWFFFTALPAFVSQFLEYSRWLHLTRMSFQTVVSKLLLFLSENTTTRILT